MKKDMRRLTAFLLAIIMIISALPLSLAEGESPVSSVATIPHTHEEGEGQDHGGEDFVVSGEPVITYSSLQEGDAQAEEEPSAALPLAFSVQEGEEALAAMRAQPALLAAPLRNDPASGGATGTLNELDGSKIENIKISWFTPDDSGNNPWPGEDKTLYLRPQDDKPQSMVYNLDVALSGQYDYQPGDIEIEIPATIWTDRDGNPVGQLRLPIPEGEEPRVDFNWRKVGDKYIIYNTRPMSAATKAHFQIEVNGIVPHTIQDMDVMNDFNATVYVNTHRGNTIQMTSNDLNAQMDTYAELTRSYKSGMLYSSLPGNLPEALRPDNPGEYIYVRWETYTYHTGNQPFTLQFTDADWQGSDANPFGDILSGAYLVDPTTQNKEHKTDAIMLGATDGSNVYTPESGVVTVPCYDGYHSPTTTSYDHVHYVWTAYKKSDLPGPTMTSQGGPVGQVNYELYNTVNWHLQEKDEDWKKPDESAVWDAQEEYDKPAPAKVTYSPMDFARPTGHFMVWKWTEQENYKDWVYGYALNKLQMGKDVEMRYVVRSDGFGYPWTYEFDEDTYRSLTEEELARYESDPQSVQKFFGKRPYRMVTDDYATFFMPFGDEVLTSKDFEMTGVELVRPQVYEYRQTAGGEMGYISAGMDRGIASYGTVPADHWAYFRNNDPAVVPDVTIYVRVGDDADDGNVNDWVEYATASWKTGSLVVTPKSGAYQGSATMEGNLLNFPPNTVDYRTELTTKEAAIIYYTYPHIIMRSNPRVVEAVNQLFENNPNPTTKFKNDDMMVAYEDNVRDDYPESEIVTLYDASRATFNAASYGVSAEKEGRFVEDNTTERRFKLHYTAAVTEQSNLKDRADYDEAVSGDNGAFDPVIPPETSGIWYDLLPPYVQPDLNSIQLRGGDGITNVFTIPNYKGSGRTLLVVRAKLTPDPRYKVNAGYYDKPTIDFDAYLTYDDYDTQIKNLTLQYQQTMDREAALAQAKREVSQLNNYVAFESTSDLRTINGDTVLGTIPGQQGENDRDLGADRLNHPYNGGTPGDLPDEMKDLHPALGDNEYRTVYAKDVTTVNKLDASWSHLSKHVSSDLEGIWTSGLSDAATQVNIYEGQGYSYRLMLEASNDTKIQDIVFYDALEWLIPGDASRYDGPTETAANDGAEVADHKDWEGTWKGRGQWRGTLQAIDLSELMARYPDLEPVVYVNRSGHGGTGNEFQFTDSAKNNASPEEIEALENDPTYELTSPLWTVLPQSDWANAAALADVQAVAIDLSRKANGDPFVLERNNSITAYLRFRAPAGVDASSAYIHNDPAADPSDDANINWDAARNPDNNMHAFNNVRSKFTTQEVDANGNPTSTSLKNMIRHDYTKVGIMPLSMAAEKTWQDNNNHDGVRPETVQIQLWRTIYRDGEGFVEEVDPDHAPVTVSADSTYTDEDGQEHAWYARFDHLLAEDSQGRPITYFVKEIMPAGVEGYFSALQRITGQFYRLINHRENEKADLSGVKQWDDSANTAGARPSAITLRLYADGKYVKSMTVTPDASGNWSWAFTGLDKYEDFNITLQNDPGATQPREIVYTVREDYIPGYTSPAIEGEIPVDDIVNTYHPKGNLQVTKATQKSTDPDAEFNFILYLFEKDQVMDETTGQMVDQGLADQYHYEILDASSTVAQQGQIGNGGAFTLKAGQTMRVVDLPSESRYRVEEAEANGYAASVQNGSGSIRAGEYNTVTAAFTNVYSAAGEAQIAVNKTLTGRDMSRAQFRFELLDGDGNVLKTASNAAPSDPHSATATFSALRYTIEDLKNDDGTYAASKTFTYTVREVDRGRPGYTYDTTVHTVTVTVTDNRDGTLSCVASPADPADIPFENSYEARGEVPLKVWKELNGRKLRDGEFEFELYYVGAFDTVEEAEGQANIDVAALTPIQTKQNDANGEVTFDPIQFVQDADHDVVGKTFLYLVKEKKGADSTVVYTDHVHAFTVTIYDNGDGTLTYGLGNHAAEQDTYCNKCNGTGIWNRYPGIIIGTRSRTAMRGSDSVTQAQWEALYDQGLYPDMARDGSSLSSYSEVTYRANATGEQLERYNSFVCSVCKGMKQSPAGEPCEACNGWGVNENAIERALANGGNYYNRMIQANRIDGTRIGHSGLVWDEVDENGVKMRNAYIVSWFSTGVYEWCPDCNGTGEIDGSVTVTGETAIPLFTNELKPGGFSLTKAIDPTSEGYDPLTPFTFKVKLIGEEFTTLDYDLGGSASIPTPDPNAPTPTPTPAPTPARALYTVAPTVDPSLAWIQSAGRPTPAPTDYLTPLTEAMEWQTVDDGSGNRYQWVIENDVLKIKALEGETIAQLQSTSSTNVMPWGEDSYRNAFKKVELQSPAKTNSANYMFYNCNALEDISSLNSMLDVSDCTSLIATFSNCSSLKDANLGQWNVSNVQNMGGLFSNCTRLETADLKNWNFERATTVNSMFFTCMSLKELNTSGWSGGTQISNVGYMFAYCYALEDLDLSGISPEPTSVSITFDELHRLKTLNLSNWSFARVPENSYHASKAFGALYSLEEINFSGGNINSNEGSYWRNGTIGADGLVWKMTFPAHATQKVSDWLRGTREGNVSQFYTGSKSQYSGSFVIEGREGVFTREQVEDIVANSDEPVTVEREKVMRTLSFDMNGDSSVDAPESVTYWTGNYDECVYTIPGIEGETERAFLGWGQTPTSRVSYYPGDQILLSPSTNPDANNKIGPITLYAVYENADDYLIKFSQGEGEDAADLGAHPNMYGNPRTANTLPDAGSFYKKGYAQTGWKYTNQDGTKTGTVALNGNLPANRFTKDDVLTVTPVWQKIDTVVTPVNNEFIITLYGGETATFDNLPAGTAYQIYEETPGGWVLIDQVNSSGVIKPNEIADACKALFTNRYEPGKAQAQFFATKYVKWAPNAPDAQRQSADGTDPDQQFRFELWQGNTLIADNVEVGEGGMVQFPMLEYSMDDGNESEYRSEEGKRFTYTIKEKVLDENETWIYDSRSVEYTYLVKFDEETNTLTARRLMADGEEDVAEFTNVKRYGALELTKRTQHATQTANDQGEFEFTFTFKDAKGSPLTDILYYIKGRQDADSNSVQPNIQPLMLQSNGLRNGDGYNSYKAPDTSKQVHVTDPDTQLAGKAYAYLDANGKLIFFRAENMLEAETKAQADYANVNYTNKLYDVSPYETTVSQTEPGWVNDKVTDIQMDGYIQPMSMLSWFSSVEMDSLGPDQLDKLDTSKCEMMDRTFGKNESGTYATKIGSLDLTSFDTSSVRRMNGMFYFADLGSLDMSSFKTSSLTTMSQMFDRATIPMIDLSTFDISKVTTVYSMFVGTDTDTISLAGWKVKENSSNGWWSRFWKANTNGSEGGPEFECKVKNLDLRGFDSSGIKGSSSSGSGYAYWQYLDLETLVVDENTILGYTLNDLIRDMPISFNIDKITESGAEMSRYIYNPEADIADQYVEGNNGFIVNKLTPGTWTLVEHTNVLTFSPNGGMGELPDDITVHAYDGTITLPKPENVVRPGYLADGWITNQYVKYDEETDSYTFTYADPYRSTFYNAPGFGPLKPYTISVKWIPDPAGIDFPVYEQLQNLDGTGYNRQEGEPFRGVIGTYVGPTPRTIPGYVLNTQLGDAQWPRKTLRDDTEWNFYYDRIRYTVKFDGNGGGGSMDDMTSLLGDVSYTLPANGFTRDGYLFTGWKLTKVNTTGVDGGDYTDRGTIKNLAMLNGATPNNATATLTAQWMKLPENMAIDPTTGKVTVRLKEGETVVFPELPDGVTYEIEETDLSAGWTLVEIDSDSGRIESGKTQEEEALNRYDAQGRTTLDATKAILGGTAEDGQFTFRLYETEADAGNRADGWLFEGQNATETLEQIENPAYDPNDPDSEPYIPNPNYGKAVVKLGPVNYTLDDLQEAGYDPADVATGSKQFTYYMVEVVPDPKDPAMEYDERVRTVTVTVTDRGDGTLDTSVEIAPERAGATFENEYKETELEITKTVVGATEKADNTFTLTVTLKDKTGNPLKGTYPCDPGGALTTDENGVGTLSITGGETIKVTGLPHGASYTIVEESRPGFTAEYDDHASGTLNYIDEPTVEGSTEITNRYDAETEWTPEGKKTLTGRQMRHGQFTFTLADEDGNVLQTAISGEPSGNEAAIEFQPIAYTAEDLAPTGERTYVYFITENNQSEGGYTYSDRVYKWTVKVTDNGDGTLTVDDTILQAEGEAVNDPHIAVNKPTFNNQYEAEADYPIEADKALTGRNLVDHEFSFTLTAVGGKDAEGNDIAAADVPMPADATAQNVSGKVTFPAIHFTQAHDGCEYTYQVTEVNPNEDDGITYDGHTYEVTLKITDNGDGTLTVAEKTATGSSTFSNEYEAEITVPLNVQKTLTGRAWTEADSFTFKLEPVGNAPMRTAKNGAALTQMTVTADKDNQSKTFDALYFDQDDLTETDANGKNCATYQYTVTEVTPTGAVNDQKDGITYDTMSVTVTVTLTDNQDGTISKTVAYAAEGDTAVYSAAEFTNEYQSQGGIVLVASKQMQNRRKALEKDEFEFELLDSDKHSFDPPMLARNDDEGRVVFPEIRYTQADITGNPTTITYYVREIQGEDTHIIRYDDHVEKVDVLLTDDGKGSISATPVYEDNHMVFVNVFTPGEISIQGTKIWVDDGAVHDNSEEITLRLIQVAQDGAETVMSAVPVWEGDTYRFTGLPAFDEEGNAYTYRVTEDQVSGYEVPVYSDGDYALDNGTITNRQGQTELSGRKIWLDGGKEHDNAREIILVLTRTSSKEGAQAEQVDVKPVWEGDTYRFAGLSKYDAEGYVYTYDVEEEQVPGYEAPMKRGNDFVNQIKPTPTPTRKPTPTPEPNRYYFSFKKVWLGKAQEKISFTVYNPDGTVKKHAFRDPKKISETEWLYEAWFAKELEYYVIEDAMAGYTTVYENVGDRVQVKDRVYNGGTIYNSSVPKTGDPARPALWLVMTMAALSMIAAGVWLETPKRRRNKENG